MADSNIRAILGRMSASPEARFRVFRSRSARFRLAFAVFVGGAVVTAACSLTVSPGDYAQGPAPKVDATAAEAATDDSGQTPAGGSRLLVFSGQRQRLVPIDNGTSISEAASAAVADDGSLGPWTFHSSPPLVGRFDNAFVTEGRLFVQNLNAIMVAQVDDIKASNGQSASFTLLRPDGGPQGDPRFFQVGPAMMLSVGGSDVVDGGTVWNGKIFGAGVDVQSKTVAEWRLLGTTIAKRGYAALVRYKDFLYAVGGRDGDDKSGLSNLVDVAALGPDGAPIAFAATEPMVRDAAKAHKVLGPTVATAPLAAGGMLFSIGGVIDATNDTLTDVVLAARIHDEDGKLDKWAVAPPLPGALRAAGAIFLKGRLYVIGGLGKAVLGDASTDSLTDAIVALDVAADGTLGAAWRPVGKLPGARSNVMAVAF